MKEFFPAIRVFVFSLFLSSIMIFFYSNIFAEGNNKEKSCSSICNLSNEPQMAIKGEIIFEDNFKTIKEYTKEYQPLKDGWKVRIGHQLWKPNEDGVESTWESGHMPVLVYQSDSTFGDVVVEVDFRFQAEPEKWGGCRLSVTNPVLNPRAYAVSVWANHDGNPRDFGMVLEHDEWKPGVITTVDKKPAQFEANKWYTLRLEIVGDYALATCNGVSVYGTQEKFGIPKTSIYIGTGHSRHDLRNFRVYEAKPNPDWKAPEVK